MTYGTFLNFWLLTESFNWLFVLFFSKVFTFKVKKDLEILTNCVNKFVIITNTSFEIHVKLMSWSR